MFCTCFSSTGVGVKDSVCKGSSETKLIDLVLT